MTELEQLKWLRSPGKCLPELGYVLDQETSRFLKYNPRRLTRTLQPIILDYFDNPPLTETGQTRWLTVLTGRQMGKSLTGEYACYPKTAYSPGWDHTCIADTRERADYLHNRVHQLHLKWDEQVRSPTVSGRETRQLTFDPLFGGKMRVLSAESGAVGVGQSPDSFHACLGAGTLVLDEFGNLKKIEDIEIGDVIRTHTGRTANVSYKSTQVKSCYLLKITGVSQEFLVTPEHKFYTKTGMRELKDIIADDCIVGFPIRSIDQTIFEMPYKAPRTIRSQGGGAQEPDYYPITLPCSYEAGRIVGLYLAEGHIPQGGKANRVEFGVHEREVARTIDWLQFIQPYVTSISIVITKSKTRKVIVYGKSFTNWLKNLGGSGRDKYFPFNWENYGEDFVRGMVHGYLSGDGHSQNYTRRISISSIRASLVVTLRDMLATLYSTWASISNRPEGKYYGRNCQEIWTLDICGKAVEQLCFELGWNSIERKRDGDYTNYEISNGYVWLDIKHHFDMGEQQVYDLEVDDPDHSFCILQAAVSNSECFLWSDFAGSMSLIYPSMINRANCFALFEATPWEAGCDWHNHCIEAERGLGRHLYKFIPFWDGILNARPWPAGASIDSEEERLLNTYGPKGLALENLAFRRLMLDTDPEIRRNPNLFKVFYPFDDVTCWQSSSVSAIPRHAIEQHQKPGLIETDREYLEIEPPDPDGQYAIGVDPCGYAARDHAAWQTLRLYEDKWIQVARYAGHTEPVRFTELLLRHAKRYNNAMIAIEANGVGQAPLGLLRQQEYPNVFSDKPGRPGFTSSSQSLDRATGKLIDALMDNIVLYDKATVEQLLTYKHDKRVEESANSELIRGSPTNKRRERHHWDLVSALIFAVVCSSSIGVQRRKAPTFETGESPIHAGLYSYKARTEEWKERQRARKPRRRW